MPKFKAILHLLTSDVECDELCETETEAIECALNWISDYHTGSEILHMSNPGDYPEDEEEIEYEIAEVSEEG